MVVGTTVSVAEREGGRLSMPGSIETECKPGSSPSPNVSTASKALHSAWETQ